MINDSNDLYLTLITDSLHARLSKSVPVLSMHHRRLYIVNALLQMQVRRGLVLDREQTAGLQP